MATKTTKASKKNLAITDLNNREQKVIAFAAKHAAHGDPVTLDAMATTCFLGTAKSKTRANSWARNAIRRPVREGYLRKTKPGSYTATAKATAKGSR